MTDGVALKYDGAAIFDDTLKAEKWSVTPVLSKTASAIVLDEAPEAMDDVAEAVTVKSTMGAPDRLEVFSCGAKRSEAFLDPVMVMEGYVTA